MANENINNEVMETTEPTTKGGFWSGVKKFLTHPVTIGVAGATAGVLLGKVLFGGSSKNNGDTDEYASDVPNEGYGDETIG